MDQPAKTVKLIFSSNNRLSSLLLLFFTPNVPQNCLYCCSATLPQPLPSGHPHYHTTEINDWLQDCQWSPFAQTRSQSSLSLASLWHLGVTTSFFFFSCHACGMWKYQARDPCHSSDRVKSFMTWPSGSSNHFLTHHFSLALLLPFFLAFLLLHRHSILVSFADSFPCILKFEAHFLLSTFVLGELILHRGCKCHSYADDFQIYNSGSDLSREHQTHKFILPTGLLQD